ncbi:MAG: hypothetical protein IJ005_04370 [Bacteroidales bacterium]|nr:hypothetical protein [Bacteroidales bacterium]
MNAFIENYLHDPSEAISSARKRVDGSWFDTIDDDMIYLQLASPEFRLYEEIILSNAIEDSSSVNRYSPVV